MGSQRAKAHYGPAQKRASSQRPDIRAQSYLETKDELFANEEESIYKPFKDAVVNSAITRAQPIMLTGLAAMLGAFFILDDPIFNGLAISLLFGISISTLLTLVVIPVLYFIARGRVRGAMSPAARRTRAGTRD